MMNKNYAQVPEVPCGNFVALTGIDQYLMKTGTIASADIAQPYPMRAIKDDYVSPIVSVHVQPKNPVDLPKLIDGIRKLAKLDSSVICYN